MRDISVTDPFRGTFLTVVVTSALIGNYDRPTNRQTWRVIGKFHFKYYLTVRGEWSVVTGRFKDDLVALAQRDGYNP